MKTLALFVISILIHSSQQYDWTSTRAIPAYISPKPRIIGGTEVEPHSIPYQVGLIINGGQYFCGGSLISENYVLTAAHCGIVMRFVDVVLGAHNITNSAEPTQVVIRSEDIHLHEDYNNTSYKNDICLIKLPQPVTLNDYIQPIKLPTSSGRIYDYQTALATGWGLFQDVPFPSTSYMSSVLMGVEVAVTNTTECTDYYNDEEYTWVTPGNICTTGYRNKGTCDGDSGGPLVLDGVLIGLTSIGTEVCEMCSPSIYTKVDYYLDWILENSDVV